MCEKEGTKKGRGELAWRRRWRRSAKQSAQRVGRAAPRLLLLLTLRRPERHWGRNATGRRRYWARCPAATTPTSTIVGPAGHSTAGAAPVTALRWWSVVASWSTRWWGAIERWRSVESTGSIGWAPAPAHAGRRWTTIRWTIPAGRSTTSASCPATRWSTAGRTLRSPRWRCLIIHHRSPTIVVAPSTSTTVISTIITWRSAAPSHIITLVISTTTVIS